MTMKEIAAIIAMETKHSFLSGDMLDQEALFEIQETMAGLMAETANKDRTGKIGQAMSSALPYIFSQR